MPQNVPQKAAFGARSRAAQQRHPKSRSLRKHLGPDLYRNGVGWPQKCHGWVPEEAAFGARNQADQWFRTQKSAPLFLRRALSLFWSPSPTYRKWDVLAANRANIGCPNRPFSAPQDWLPNHMDQQSGTCAFFKGALVLYLWRANSLQKWGLLAANVAEKAASSTRSLAVQSRHPAPRLLL